MNENPLVGWLARNIPLHLDWCNTFVPPEGMTRDQFMWLWISWGLSWGLIKVFNNNEQQTIGYIFARPIRLGRMLEQEHRYFDTLFEFDSTGSVAWIDTIWAQGCYPEVLSWLRASGRYYVAWQHKSSYYITEISALSGDRPIKSQIASALIIGPVNREPVPTP